MKLLPRLSALLCTAALAAGLAVGTASSASAQLIPDGVYSLSYTDTLYQVRNSDHTVHALSSEEWKRLGYPAPQRRTTEWVKYPWSPTVYAVTFFGSDRDEWVWDQATNAQWGRAGFPAVRNAGWVKGSEFYRWETSDELFVKAPDGSVHKLTGPQWAAAGNPAPSVRSNRGYVKYSWNPTIVRMDDLQNGRGAAISSDEWRSQDYPTPRTVARVPGDQVYRNYGSADIWYAGPGVNTKLSGQQWRAMGSPAPNVQNVPPRPGNTKSCKDFSSRQAAQAEFDYYYEAYGDVYGLDRDNDRKVCETYKY